MTRKTTDSTIDEIHRTRREVSDRFRGDIFAIAEDAARRQAASNRPIWTPKQEQTRTAEPATATVSNGESSMPTE